MDLCHRRRRDAVRGHGLGAVDDARRKAAVVSYATALLLVIACVAIIAVIQFVDDLSDGYPARQRRLKADLKRRTRAMRSFK